MTEFPPEPWNLAGQAHVSTWRLPVLELPGLPDGVQPIAVAGQAFVFTAWIDYQEQGELACHELVSAVVVRGKRATVSITGIWVDNEVSLAGGRALWGIPKDLAALDFRESRTFTASAATADGWIATAAFSSRARGSLTLPAGFDIAQSLDGRLKHTPVRAKASPQLVSASWNINPGGPLRHLTGRIPVVNLNLRNFTLRFGA
jgi:hypothetical protein